MLDTWPEEAHQTDTAFCLLTDLMVSPDLSLRIVLETLNNSLPTFRNLLWFILVHSDRMCLHRRLL